jgi:hypothetical protein
MLPQDFRSSPKHDTGVPEPNALPTEAADNIEIAGPRCSVSAIASLLKAIG